MHPYATGKTDVGIVRSNNEDTIFLSDEPVGVLPNLYIVADGMGGHNAGEVASSDSVAFFLEDVKAGGAEAPDTLDILVGAVRDTNRRIAAHGAQNPEMAGMGTTFTACTVWDDKAYIAHVGDSRIYLISDGAISQVTIDHTYVNEMVRAGQITKEEARTHPQRNVITRVLGTGEELSVDAFVIAVKERDRLLLCSDGLTNMLQDEEICEAVQADGGTLDEKAEALVRLANQRGGQDNISVILVEMRG